MAEIQEYLKEESDTEIELKKFIKKFIKIKPEKAKEMRGKIEDLELMKIKPEHITKIIDFMPSDIEDINKIFTDVSLNEDEAKKILDTIKEYK